MFQSTQSDIQNKEPHSENSKIHKWEVTGLQPTGRL